MEPTHALIDELYRDKVRQARAMSPEEKFLAGGELFEFCCELMASGIRMDHPDADEEEVRRLMAARLELGRRLENRT